MAAVTDINLLLGTMRPVLAPGEFVYATVRDLADINPADVLCVFREDEGITIICPQTYAERHGLPYDGIFCQITLSVHSSLQAVGFLAIVSKALAKMEIPCNAISAFYHDHIFVPSALASKAMNVLSSLSARSQNHS